MKVALAYLPSEQQFLPMPPLGVTVLSSYLKTLEIENDVFDLELELWLSQGGKSSQNAEKNINEIDNKDIDFESTLEKLLPYEIVCFSMMGKRQEPYLVEISKLLRAKSTKLKKIIVGGAFFTNENVENFIISYKDIIDYAIVGEGWKPLSELIGNLIKKTEINSIHGVALYDEKVGYCFWEEEMWDKDLTVPDYSQVNTEGYILQQKKLYGLEDESIMYQLLVGDRNCPYSCSFCRISKNTKKVKEACKIAEEMVALNERFGCSRYSLVCNEMNPTPAYLNEFIEVLLNSNKKIDWFCYLRPNKLSYDTLVNVKEAGCNLVRYGVESGSQNVLDHMNKKLYVEEMEQILRDSHNAGIWNHINIMTGYLHETEEDIEKTISFIDQNHKYIDSVRINTFFIPFGSPIHKKPEKYGIKLISNEGSHIVFEQPDCSWKEKQEQIKQSTKRVLDKCIELGVCFGGILPHFVSTAISHFGNKEKAKAWLKENHSYLWEPLSPDTAKWRLAHPERPEIEINQWEEIAGKRGANYQLAIDKNE